MTIQILNRTLVALFAASLISTSAIADINPALKAMLETAIKSGDEAQVLTLKNVAITTWPKEEQAIIALIESLTAQKSIDLSKDQNIAKVDKSITPGTSAGLGYYLNPALWNGQLELGGGTSTGNTEEQGLSIGLSFKRIFAEKWEHDLDSDFDYAKSQGITTKRQITARYKVLWKPWDRFYTMNYIQLEADKFSGYKYRITENIGMGYEIINNKNMLWRIEGGPGVRFNKLDITNERETEFLGRISNTFEMELFENIKFANKSSAVFTSGSTTIDNKTRLSARVNAHLAAKLSFAVKHDTGAPIGKEKTDTISRATLVFDF